MNDVREHLIRGALGRRGFYGVLLAEHSTETPYRPRWIEMTVYRDWEVKRDDAGEATSPLVPVGPRGYVLQVVGRSVVYHKHESRCHNGLIPVHNATLDDDAEPCAACKPGDLDDLEPEEIVDTEKDRFTVHQCATTDELVERLHDPKSPAGSGLDGLSAPAQTLLQLAAAKDEPIAAAINAVQWL